jgi:hypothetical protein
VQTILAHFWGRSLQTPKIFFSIDGRDEQSKEMAPLQKESLMEHFKKDRVPQKLDKGLNLHGITKGLMYFHVGVCNRKRQLHGKRDLLGLMEGVDLPDYAIGAENDEYLEVEQKLYEGATLNVIDPYDFVFDTEAHEDWDACFKAYKRWMVYEDIEDEPNYTNFEELYELVQSHSATKGKSTQLSSNKRKKAKTETGINDSGRLEVIEFHGDIRLKDGTYLRNWTIVVAGRQKVIRFEQNPFYVNPFIKWEYEETEDGMGISPIEYILPLIDASSILLSTGVEGAKMSVNPPWLAEESHFQQKKTFLSEGTVIKYKSNLTIQDKPPQPIPFNYQAPFQYVALFEGQAESVTGATRQLSGNVTTNDKVQTATEFQGLQVVGNLLIDRIVDKFNLDAKIPIIEKMALINAMFAPLPKSVRIENEKGTTEYKEVTPEVYAGNFDYIIEDNKSEMERKQNQREKLDLFFMGMQDPRIAARAKPLELWKELWRDFGYGKPGAFVMDDMEYVQDQAKELQLQALIQSLAMQAGNGFINPMGGLPNEQAPDVGGPQYPPEGFAASEGMPGEPGIPSF